MQIKCHHGNRDAYVFIKFILDKCDIRYNFKSTEATHPESFNFLNYDNFRIFNQLALKKKFF